MHASKRLLFRLCAPLPLKPLLKLNGKNSLFIPIYHAITNERLIHLEHILPYGSKNSRQFEQDLDHLLKHLHPVSFDELNRSIQSEGKPLLPKNSFFITFDDGLRQTYELATEILLKKGVPAAFFINTAAMDNRYLLHRYKASILIDALKTLKQNASGEVLRYLLQHQINASSAADGIRLLHFGLRHHLDVLAGMMEISFDEYLKAHRPFMTSDQVKDLSNKGFIVGSHSHEHPEYWQLTTEEKVQQTCEAMNRLTELTGETRRSFAFPFLDWKTDTQFFKALQQAGPFDLMFGSQKLKHDIIPNMIHRFDGDNNLGSMGAYLKVLLADHLVRRCLGKDRAVRPE